MRQEGERGRRALLCIAWRVVCTVLCCASGLLSHLSSAARLALPCLALSLPHLNLDLDLDLDHAERVTLASAPYKTRETQARIQKKVKIGQTGKGDDKTTVREKKREKRKKEEEASAAVAWTVRNAGAPSHSHPHPHPHPHPNSDREVKISSCVLRFFLLPPASIFSPPSLFHSSLLVPPLPFNCWLPHLTRAVVPLSHFHLASCPSPLSPTLRYAWLATLRCSSLFGRAHPQRHLHPSLTLQAINGKIFLLANRSRHHAQEP